MPKPLDWDSPGVKLITYQACKGLEFDTVFFPELQLVKFDPTKRETKQQFYVAITRARNELIMTYSGQEKPPFCNLFPDYLIRTDDTLSI